MTHAGTIREVALLSAAALPIGWLSPKGEELQGFEQDFLSEVTHDALAIAGLDKRDVDSVVFAAPPPSTLQGGFGTFMAAHLGLTCCGQVSEVLGLGVTGGLAFDQALADVQLGRAKVALCMGVSLDMFENIAVAAERGLQAVGDVDFQAPFGLTPIAWYALDAARYMHETGAKREQIAHVAVKSRKYAQMNPVSQFTKDLSIDDVMAQRPIVEPLGLLEVPARADGAICMALTTKDIAQSSGKPYALIKSRGYYHEGRHQIGDHPHDITAFPAATNAAQSAMDDANTALSDIDVFELYAPCTITEVLASEAIGLFKRGEGATAAKEGITAPGGEVKLNTSGGCLSRGHPPGLTGMYGVMEIWQQLTGQAGARQVDNAALGLHMCELGNYNAALVHILEAAS